MSLDYLSDNLIELRGPVNVATDAAVSTILSGNSVVTAKLYDTALDTRLSDAPTTLSEDYTADPSSAVITVQSVGFIQAGTQLLIEVNGSSFKKREVLSVALNVVTLTTVLGTTPADKGNAVLVHTYSTLAGFVEVTDIQGWEQDMTIEITRTDGTLAEFTAASPDIPASRIWLNGATLGVTALVGALVKRKLGDDIEAGDFSDFGTFPTSDPVAGDPTWGMRAVIDHDHADLALGMRVRGEITLIDSAPTPALNLTRKVVGTLTNE